MISIYLLLDFVKIKHKYFVNRYKVTTFASELLMNLEQYSDNNFF